MRPSSTPAKIRATALVLAAIAGPGLAATAPEPDLSRLPPPATRKVEFDADIKPVLEQNCLKCHGPERPKSRFRLDNRASALKGGNNGVDIIPGNSAKSPLIHHVARLDQEMAMPPEGKGEPLTRDQVALLRAWIDQGASWGAQEPASQLSFTVAPAVGYVTVHGNEAKFREQWWMRDGWRGGIESFELSETLSPEAKVTIRGRALTDDYHVELRAEKQDLGFVQAGFDQFRKYDDDTGGYFGGTNFSRHTFRLDRDLHLDLGRAWFDVGLTLPDWPRIVLGYEYRYRNGDEGTLQWGKVENGNEADARNIYPALKTIGERAHILKLDVDFERGNWRIEDSFRGEWGNLSTRQDNVIATLLDTNAPSSDRMRQGQQSFQGMNTTRIERQFNDWLYGSAGYLYSHLQADAEFNLDEELLLFPGFSRRTNLQSSQRIVLERESHVANLNALLGPWEGCTLALGVQSEWTHQNGTTLLPGPATSAPSELLLGDIDRAVVGESATFRFTRLPFTTLFAEARLEQESINQHETNSANNLSFSDIGYSRHTDASSNTRDLRAGFSTSPRAWLTLGSQYRYNDHTTSYDDGLADNTPAPPDIPGYPTLIKSREITMREIESRLVVHPWSWLKTTFTHRLEATDYHTSIEPFTASGSSRPGSVAGGRLAVGNYDAQVFSFNAALTPCRRLQLSTTLTYQDVRSITFDDAAKSALVPYRGSVYGVLCHGRYVLSERTDLTLAYTFSEADFRQHNGGAGLPLGVAYDLHGVQAGIETRFNPRLSTKLQYGFYRYREPSFGSVNDYTAHALFASLNLHFR